eukprot:Nk52_evm13s2367 gene=Nk52_evmTU13s2367
MSSLSEGDDDSNPFVVVFVSPLTTETGNHSTVFRISEGLAEDERILVELISCYDITCADLFKDCLREQRCRVVIAIHAFKSGRYLTDCDAPLIVVLGGTDINEDTKDPGKAAIMGQVLERAKAIVGFSQAMVDKAVLHWPTIAAKCRVIPQGVVVNVGSGSTKDRLCLNRLLLGLNIHGASGEYLCENVRSGEEEQREQRELKENDKIVFILPASIRPVKDPMYLLDVFAKWRQSNPKVTLMIIGRELDEEYGTVFKQKLASLREMYETSCGIEFIGEVPQSTFHACLHDCFAVVNSSVSEGMSNVILEAMALQIPVIARENPGNSSLIKHEETGMLFDKPEEFIECATTLINHPELYKDIVRESTYHVNKYHSYPKEIQSYKDLIFQIYSSGEKTDP